jgi:Porin subfamily
MRPVKQVLLGSAAGLFAVAGAQAADLAVKAAPVEYVKVCSLYGAGFWYIPGTDTCLKIGGFVRFEVNFNADASSLPAGTAGSAASLSGGATRATGQMSFRERSLTSFDSRTQTEYGTLRSYFDIGQIAQPFLGGVSGTSGINPLGVQTGGNYAVYTDRAFLQFAGLTAGRMRSFFDMVFLAGYQNAGSRYTGDSSPAGITGIGYTWQFGGGLSASLSLEDGGWAQGGHGRSTVNLAGGNAPPAASDIGSAFAIGQYMTDNKGQEFFDPVANIRLDQAWGFVGASFALHDASGGYYGNNTTTTITSNPTGVAPCITGQNCGHPGDVFGWAASVGGTWVNPFGLQGDTLAAQAVYTQGAVGYATGQFGSSAIYGAGNKIGMSYIVDGVYDYGSSVQLTHMWSVNGVYEHLWNPQWKTSLTAGAMGIDYAGGKALICPGGAGGTPNPVGFTANSGSNAAFTTFGNGTGNGQVSNCNPNSSWFGLGTRTMWTPHPDIDFSLDFHWEHLNTAFGGTANMSNLGTQFQPGAGARPAGLYNVSNMDVFSVYFAVRRGWVF